jgi:hypothetical protein
MADEVSLYRARADAERVAASAEPLQNIRDRCERSAKAWTAMADRAEYVSQERRKREAASKPATPRTVDAEADQAQV